MVSLSLLLVVSASVAVLASVARAEVPFVTLTNSAVPGTRYAAYGLGTGGYGTDKKLKYPECWADPFGCGGNTIKAVTDFLAAGGRRIDNADSYGNQDSVGTAMRESGVARSDIFLTTKVGPSNPLGYNDTLSQWANTKKQMQIE